MDQNPSSHIKLEKSVLTVATVTSFLGPFMLSAVNVALPVIQKDLAANAVELSWIATSYLLATAVCLVPVGRIADIHGRRRFFILGLTVFTIANFLTLFMREITPFIWLRVLQGTGAAMTVTTGMAIVTSVFPPERRGKAIGIYVSAVYVGLSAGPFGGGLLAQHFGWQSIFMVTTAIGLLSIAVAIKGLKGNEWADAAGEPIDVIGSILYGTSLVLLVYGATLLPAGSAVAMITAGILFLVVFSWYELRLKHPVFEIRLFSSTRLFAFSSTAALIHYAATFAVTFLLSLYLQYIKGMSPQAAGTLLVAQPICMALFSPLAGKLSDRVEPWKIASAGMGATAMGLAVLVFVDGGTSLYVIAGILITLGIGFALFSSPNMSAIMGAVAPRFYGTASGTVATMRLVGQMISMALVTVVFALMIGKTAISPQNYSQFLFSMHLCLSIFSVLCIVGIVFSLYRGTLRKS